MVLDSAPTGQKEAAVGLSPLDALRFVILMQGLGVSRPALLRLAILMRQASSPHFPIVLPELVAQVRTAGFTTFGHMSILGLAGLPCAAICVPATPAFGAKKRPPGQHT